MKSLLGNSKSEVRSEDPELRAFIYQQIQEFRPYISLNTVIEIVEKDIKGLLKNLELEGVDVDPNEFEGKTRVMIKLTENQSNIEVEGLGEDVFSAIGEAKLKMIKVLQEIQNEVVSQNERLQEINRALSSVVFH